MRLQILPRVQPVPGVLVGPVVPAFLELPAILGARPVPGDLVTLNSRLVLERLEVLLVLAIPAVLESDPARYSRSR